MGDASSVEAAPPPTLNVPRLLVTTVLILVILGGLAAAAGFWFREPLEALSASFVQALGGPGVALAYWIPDAFTVPLPSDAVSLMGITGGMTFSEVVAWGTAGSLAGGSTGFFLGRGLARTPWARRKLARRGEELTRLLERYGAVTLAAAALTPLPYSIVCWISAGLGMRFSLFFAVSLLRTVRVAGYLWIVQAGYVSLQ